MADVQLLLVHCTINRANGNFPEMGRINRHYFLPHQYDITKDTLFCLRQYIVFHAVFVPSTYNQLAQRQVSLCPYQAPETIPLTMSILDCDGLEEGYRQQANSITQARCERRRWIGNDVRRYQPRKLTSQSFPRGVNCWKQCMRGEYKCGTNN